MKNCTTSLLFAQLFINELHDLYQEESNKEYSLEEIREMVKTCYDLPHCIPKMGICNKKYQKLAEQTGFHCYVLSCFDTNGKYIGVKVGKTEKSVNKRASQIMNDKNNPFLSDVVIEKIFDCPTVDDMYALECLLHKWARNDLGLEQRRADFFLGDTEPSEEDYEKLDRVADRLFDLL